MQYIVKLGDSFYKIARRFDISLEQLMSANQEIRNPNLIYPGQIVNIPGVKPITYDVKPGESLFTIAQKFMVTVNQILALNPAIKNPNLIYVDQKLRLPAMRNRIVEPTGTYSYDEMVADINELQATYPFINFVPVGQSVQGRNLYVVRLGVGPKEVHYQGAIHANEWITAAALMKFIEDYAIAYSTNTPLDGYNIQDLYNQTKIWVMPMSNPDGVQLVTKGISPGDPLYDSVLTANDGSTDFSRWRANIRGVDLNDQFPAFWEEEKARSPVTRPYYQGYPGPFPFSEPESKAIGDFTYSHNFRLIVSVHTQGGVIFWGYRGFEPAESQVIAQTMSNITGYQPVQYVDSDAGYRDWFILDWRRPGFTVEVGQGVNPLPISQLPQIYSKLRPLLLYSAVA